MNTKSSKCTHLSDNAYRDTDRIQRSLAFTAIHGDKCHGRRKKIDQNRGHTVSIGVPSNSVLASSQLKSFAFTSNTRDLSLDSNDEYTYMNNQKIHFPEASLLPPATSDITKTISYQGIPVSKRPISGCIKELIEERKGEKERKNSEKSDVSPDVEDLLGNVNKCTSKNFKTLCISNEDTYFYLKSPSLSAVTWSPTGQRYKTGKKSPHTRRRHRIDGCPKPKDGKLLSMKEYVVTRRHVMSTNLSTNTGDQKSAVVLLKVQFLIVTERLKVTIVRAENILGISSNVELPTTFVQLSLMPGKMQKQSGKCVKNSSNPDYSSEVFYFTGFNLECMHMMTLRIKIMQRKYTFRLPLCIGETYIPLDNVDLVGETLLRERLSAPIR